MKKQFVRGGTYSKGDREYKKRWPYYTLLIGTLFFIGLVISGCFGERVSDKKPIASSALAPGSPFYRVDPQKRLLLRKSIVDRTGTILAVSERDKYGNPKRVYPYGEMARELLGFVDGYGRGLEGIEYVYDDLLSPIEPKKNQMPVVLSLEKNLQEECQLNLNWQIRRLRAKKGSIIIMDLKTGNILAMANKASQEGEKIIAIKETINPWPLIYCLSLLQNIEEQTLQEQSENKEKSVLNENNKIQSLKTVRWHWHLFKEDSGVWTRVKEDHFENLSLTSNTLSTLIALGLGQKTGIDLPDENQGTLPMILSDNMTQILDSQAEATPLQLLFAFSRLVANKNIERPSLLLSKSSNENTKERAILDENTHKRLLELIGDNSGPSVASFLKKGEGFQVIGLGFWPKKNPKVVYISCLFDAKLRPDRRRGTLGRMVHLARMGADAINKRFQFEDGVSLALKRPFYKKAKIPSSNKMPDLIGLSMRSAIEMMEQMGVTPKISGKGTVKAQFPKPGKRISKEKGCLIICES